MAALVALGTVLGLAWNAFSGRGLVLSRNAFLKEGDQLQEIPPAEARRRLDRQALFLDARPRAFYDMSHIPGALPLPEDDFERAFTAIEPRLRSTFDIVVYCSGYGCEASHNVTRLLQAKGVHAVILQGGWPDWTDAGYPVKAGSQP
jgi:rhodanese-related sulfurtransferase